MYNIYIYCESDIPKILNWGSPTTATCDTQFRCPPMKSALPPAWEGAHGWAPNWSSMGSQWKSYGTSSTMCHMECWTLTLIKKQQKEKQTQTTKLFSCLTMCCPIFGSIIYPFQLSPFGCTVSQDGVFIKQRVFPNHQCLPQYLTIHRLCKAIS